jgi:hypothetical protein
MARERLNSRELSTAEQAGMDEIKELMTIVNSDPDFTPEAKETFRLAALESGAVHAMMNKYILTDEERNGLLNALRILVGSLKVN